MIENEQFERIKKAFDFASETSKQILTLSSAIIALTVTFLKDIAGKDNPHICLLKWGWGMFILSIVFGIFAIMALTGNLEKPDPKLGLSVYASNIRFFQALQFIFFIGGLVFSVWFAAIQ